MSIFRIIYLLLLFVTAFAVAYAAYVIIALNWWNDGLNSFRNYTIFSVVSTMIALSLIGILGREIFLSFRKLRH